MDDPDTVQFGGVEIELPANSGVSFVKGQLLIDLQNFTGQLKVSERRGSVIGTAAAEKKQKQAAAQNDAVPGSGAAAAAAAAVGPRWPLALNDGAWHWHLLERTPSQPLPRWGHATAAIGGQIFVLGGETATGCLEDGHAYDPTTRSWSPVNGAQGSLKRRAWMAVQSFFVVDSDDELSDDDADLAAPNRLASSSGLKSADPSNQGKEKLLLFGGETAGSKEGLKDRMATNDCLVFDPVYSIWYDAQTTGPKPCPRSGHAMARLGCHVYVFGGFYARSGFMGDLFVLDTEVMTWKKIEVEGGTGGGGGGGGGGGRGSRRGSRSSPPARKRKKMGRAAAAAGGGVEVAATAAAAAAATAGMAGVLPAGRAYHTLTADPGTPGGGSLYLLGGNNEEESLPDLHVFNTDTASWWQPNVSGEVPSARIGASAALIPSNSGSSEGAQLVLYGGWDYGSGSQEDRYFGDVRVLDTASWHWTAPDLGQAARLPSARAGMQLVLVGGSGGGGGVSCMVFGGRDQNEEFVEDTWLLQLPASPASDGGGGGGEQEALEGGPSSPQPQGQRRQGEDTELQDDTSMMDSSLSSEPGDEPMSPTAAAAAAAAAVTQSQHEADFRVALASISAGGGRPASSTSDEDGEEEEMVLAMTQVPGGGRQN
jgi:N-acetylneuraminic acid mutarotase